VIATIGERIVLAATGFLIALIVLCGEARAQTYPPNSLTLLPASFVGAAARTQSSQGGPLGAPWRLLMGYEGGNYFIYPYGILKIPLWGNLDNGWTLKVSADGLVYEFEAGQLGKIHATAPAAEMLVGYSFTREFGGVSALIGPQYRHTSYNKGFQSSNHYDDWGFKGEATLNAHWGTLLHIGDIVHSSVSGSYATENEFYRVQGRPLLLGKLAGIQAGPEATLLGNPDFQRQQYGVVVTNLSLGWNITVTAHGGYQRHEALSSGDVIHGVYYGVSMMIPFGGPETPVGTEDEPP
jgi:cellulose biosynthesis protein BcsS